MPTPSKPRLILLTGSIAAVTVAGTLYGAGLKTRREIQQARDLKMEETDEQKLEALVAAREKLARVREGVRRKVEEVRAGGAGGDRGA